MERYVKLKDVEKAIIKRIDWSSENRSPVEIRNDILEVLNMINFIYLKFDDDTNVENWGDGYWKIV